ncbi:MAG TPA: hypothetical protein VL400_15100, partial [Polyangiaceae bacterium]|nr:hypothetical protein [Polyangiaceae bacterium]
MTLAPSPSEVGAIRLATAWTKLDHAATFVVEGEGAFDAVDALVSSDLFLSDAALRPALVLDDAGQIVADAIVGRLDDRYLLQLEGPSRADAHALVESVAASHGARVVALDATHVALGLLGPYAWELLGEWLGPDLVGMPYLSAFQLGETLVLRAGKTGEFGYDVLLPRDTAEDAIAKLLRIGVELDLASVGLDALDLCALENGFFCVRREGALVTDLAELQLRWRVGRDKSFRGSAAVRSRAASGPVTHRVTWLRSAASLDVGDVVALENEPIGTVVAAGKTVLREGFVGLARIAQPWASAGIGAF